jgi:hypothetical protein
MKHTSAKFYARLQDGFIMRATALSILLSSLIPKFVFGQVTWFEVEPIPSLEGTGAVSGLFDRLINFAVGLLVIVAVVLIVYSAYLHLFAGGEVEKVKKARQWIVYVAVAIAVALLSKGLIYIFAEIVGGEDVANRVGDSL